MAGGIAIIIAGLAMIKTDFIDWALDQMRTPTQVEGELMAKANTASILKAVKANYPDQFKKMIQDYSDEVRKGRLAENEEIRLINEYYSFMATKRVLAPNASESTLLELAKLRSEVADALYKGDRSSCNSTYSGRADPLVSPDQKVSSGYAQIDYLIFKAAREAEANPVPRDLDPQKDADNDALLLKAFAMGLKKETETVGNMIYTRPVGDSCDYNYFLYKATLALPKDQMIRISARMTAQ